MSTARARLATTLGLLALACAKTQGSEGAPPPAPPPSRPVETTVATGSASTPRPNPAPSAGASLPSASASAVSALLAPPEPAAQPPLLDPEGKPLPQTDERPRADDPAFLARLELLVRAIERDEPELAHAAFFPVVAYQQVKAIEKPERDHERRLLTAFARDVHEYHRALGSNAEGARFLDVQIDESRVKFMKPGSEGNRLGYFRVVRPTLRIRTRDGAARSFEITSLISWRGGWYVVHLHGFS